MKAQSVSLTVLECLRCEHSWVPRREELPLRCPSCRSPYWRKPKKTAEAKADNGKLKALGCGIIRAREAIDILIRIPKNDALRKRGFQLVKDWIRHNL